MSKTIEQLAILAAQIEEATRQGENTALRVGGLFSDIVDYLATLHLNDITLGPLLTSLNNSGLLEPSDGQTLAFSIMDDKWKYSDAITQLKLSIRGIEQTVASNYRAFLQVKDELEAQVNATDKRVREYKTEYDQSQIEYATWKSQTDTSISQYATAINKMTGDIISISGRVDTAYDQLDFVTNDLEAADKAIGKIFDLAGMDLSDEPSASWLYKNKEGIYGAAATFDTQGNIKSQSKLGVTVNSIQSEVSNATGQVSLISQTVEQISARVTDLSGKYSDLKIDVNGITSTVYDPEVGNSVLKQRADDMRMQIETIDGRTADMGIYVQKDGDGYITNARIRADRINLEGYTTINEGFSVDKHGNVTMNDCTVNGTFHGKIDQTTSLGNSSGTYYRLELYTDERIPGTSVPILHSGIRGLNGNNTYFDLTFTGVGTGTEVRPLMTMSQGTFSKLYSRWHPDQFYFTDPRTGTFFSFGVDANGKISIFGTRSAWPYGRDAVSVGEVFVGDDECLRIKMT